MSSQPTDLDPAICAALNTYIREHFKVPPTDPDFSEEVHLFDYGYIDSFGAVELTNFVQNQFHIPITESDLVAYPLNSIREIATFIQQRQKGLI